MTQITLTRMVVRSSVEKPSIVLDAWSPCNLRGIYVAVRVLPSPSPNLHLRQILLHIFQPSQSWSSPSSTFLRFTLRYYLTALPWPIRTTYPIHSSLFVVISAIMSTSWHSSLNSRLFLILHIPCSTTDPYSLNIFLSHALSLFRLGKSKMADTYLSLCNLAFVHHYFFYYYNNKTISIIGNLTTTTTTTTSVSTSLVTNAITVAHVGLH